MILFTRCHRVTVHRHVDIQRRGGGAVVVIAHRGTAAHHIVPGAHVLHRFCRPVKQARRLAVRQAHIKPVTQLAVGKNKRLLLRRRLHL